MSALTGTDAGRKGRTWHQLSEDEREDIHDRVSHGTPVEEVAKAHGVEVGVVRTTYHLKRVSKHLWG